MAPNRTFAARLEPDGCCAILHLEGELDIATVSIAERSIAEAAAFEHLIFDCHELQFIDSSGIRAMLAAREQMSGAVAVVHARQIVDKAITVTGLDTMLHLVVSLEEARRILHC